MSLAPPSSIRSRLASTSGVMRDAIGAIHNLHHLLGSVKVGPKALSRVIPDVQAACAPLIAAAQDLITSTREGPLASDAYVELGELCIRRAEELNQALIQSPSSSLKASERLKLEQAVANFIRDLDGALDLVDLLAQASAPGDVVVDVVQLLRESTQRNDSMTSRGKKVKLALDVPPAPVEVHVNPRLTISLLGFLVALGAGRHAALLMTLESVAGECELTAAPAVELPAGHWDLVVPSLMELTARCASDVARASGYGLRLDPVTGFWRLALPLSTET